MKSIQIKEFGGPEVLEHVEVADPAPGEGEVVVEVSRCGVNFADTHATRNDYPAALLRGSKTVVGFWLIHLLARPDLAIPMIGELLGAVAAGELEATIGGIYPLSEARRAHEDLISRRSSGKLLLDPSK